MSAELEAERLQKEEAEQRAREKEEAERVARERADAKRAALEKAAADRAAKVALLQDADRAAKARAEAKRLAAEQVEAERLAALEEAERQARAREEAERRAREQLEAERQAREREEAQKLAQLARERAEAERLARECAAATRRAAWEALSTSGWTRRMGVITGPVGPTRRPLSRHPSERTASSKYLLPRRPRTSASLPALHTTDKQPPPVLALTPAIQPGIQQPRAQPSRGRRLAPSSSQPPRQEGMLADAHTASAARGDGRIFGTVGVASNIHGISRWAPVCIANGLLGEVVRLEDGVAILHVRAADDTGRHPPSSYPPAPLPRLLSPYSPRACPHSLAPHTLAPTHTRPRLHSLTQASSLPLSRRRRAPASLERSRPEPPTTPHHAPLVRAYTHAGLR